MLFSIIVPVYNVQNYLIRCLESIEKQQCRDFEVIIVDDGSTDQCPVLCDDFAKNKNYATVIHKKNGGLSSARNAGINVASGEYIIFVDSDDWIADSTLEVFEAILRSNDVDLLTARAFTVDENGNTKDKLKYCIATGKYGINDYLNEMGRNNCYSACAPFTVYRRSMLVENGILFKDKLIHEDELWTPTVLFSANSVYVSDLYFYYHFHRKESINNATKNNVSGENLYVVYTELKKLISGKSKEYAKVIREQMVILYLQSICLVDDYTRFVVSGKELRENSYSGRTKIKAWLFSLSPKMYVKIHNMYRH